jgi:hypothetical protein
MDVWSQYGSYPETGLGEINRDLLEADFWPGIASGLRVTRGEPSASVNGSAYASTPILTSRV